MLVQILFSKTRTKLHFFHKWKLYKIIYYFILQNIWFGDFFHIMAINTFRLMAPVFCLIHWRHCTFLRCERLKVNMVISLYFVSFLSKEQASFLSICKTQAFISHLLFCILQKMHFPASCPVFFSLIQLIFGCCTLSLSHHNSALPSKSPWSPKSK